MTVSASHVAHLVHLCSHYLSLRLPAEITLPHKDYPLPTIFSPSSSYTTTRPIPFPGTTPSQSPEASRHKDHNPTTTTTPTNDNDTRPLPRPRILHLSTPLPSLAKDEPLAYASFVEAITFLAWDTAWLCRTQGLPVGQSSWDDICAIGRNLYQLLLAPPLPPSPSLLSPSPSAPIPAARSPLPSSASSPAARSAPQKSTARSPQDKPSPHIPAALLALAPPSETTLPAAAAAAPPPPPPAGHFSHNSSYAFLAAAAGGGSEYMRSWRLASAVKAVERVKGLLLAERTGAEWEILEG